MYFLKHYPTPASGLALGILSISGFWAFFIANPIIAHGFVTILGTISLILLIPTIIKLLIIPKELSNALKKPSVSCILPTISMSLMLISHAFNGLGILFSSTCWLIAIAVHAMLLMFFILYRAKDFQSKDVEPSWFIPPVGMAVACLTTPNNDLLLVSQGICLLTAIGYIIIFSVIVKEFIKNTFKTNAAHPASAVLAAPASLLLAGYLSISHEPQPLFIIILYTTAIIKTSTVYLLTPKLIRLPFHPSCACLTFPLAISAIASLKVSQWMLSLHALAGYSHLIELLAIIQGIACSYIITLIFIRYIRFIVSKY
mgnify:CR=1 FL=1